MHTAILFLMLAFQPAPSDVVVAYHGARTEYVFTQGATVTAKRPRQTAAQIRARLSADDDGGTIYLDGGPSTFPVSVERDLSALKTAMGGCEWLGPRLDGTRVEVCGGSVVAVALGSDVRRTVGQ